MNSVQTPISNAPANTVSDSYLDALIDSLQDPIEAACYLTAIIEAEDPEPELLPLALNDVSKALDKTGASTQSLEMILQMQGTESIYGLVDWLKGLGLRLTVSADTAEAQSEEPDRILEKLDIAA
jgi:DNA-binding phage protein